MLNYSVAELRFNKLICSIIFNKDFEIKGARKEMCNS